jgi:cell division septal protein FtsQ
MIAGTALETMRTKGKFIARGWMYAAVAGLTPLVILTLLWLILVSPMSFSVVSNHYVSSDTPIAWRVKDSAGKSHRIQIQDASGATKDKLTSDEYSDAISGFVS